MANELTIDALSGNLPYAIRPRLGAMKMKPFLLLLFAGAYVLSYVFSPSLFQNNLLSFVLIAVMIPALVWDIWQTYNKHTFRQIILSDTGIDVERRNGEHVRLTWKQIDSVEDPADEDTWWTIISGTDVLTIRREGIVPTDWQKLSEVIRSQLLPELVKARPQPDAFQQPVESNHARTGGQIYNIKPSRWMAIIVVIPALTCFYAVLIYLWEMLPYRTASADNFNFGAACIIGSFLALLSYFRITPRSIEINDRGLSIESYKGKTDFTPWEYIKSVETGLFMINFQATHRSFSLSKYVLSSDDRDRLVRDVNSRRRACAG